MSLHMSEDALASQMGRLWFTIAIPRAGKSTVANDWVLNPKPEDGPYRPRVIVSGDDFRKAIHQHDYIPEAEGIVFSHMDVTARALLRRGFDVCMDETCTSQSTLMRYLRIDLEARPIWVNTSLEVCKARALEAGKGYLVGPIERMHAQLTALRADFPAIVEKLKSYVLMRRGLDVMV